MKFSDKIVTELPLKEIWTDKEILKFRRNNYLKKNQLKKIINSNNISFVIANPGEKLVWIHINSFYNIWEKEIKDHLINDPEYFELKNLKDEYGYLASEWSGETTNYIILFEKFH